MFLARTRAVLAPVPLFARVARQRGVVARHMRDTCGSQVFTSGFPGRATLTEWLSRTDAHFARTNASWTDGTGPMVCEVNYRSANVALAFLCHFSAARYLGLDFGNASRAERHVLQRSAVASRARVFPGDAWRSVLAAPLLAQCDVTVVGLWEHATTSTELQQRLLQDLPNALRVGRASSTSGGMLLVHGAQCTSTAATAARSAAAPLTAPTVKGRKAAKSKAASGGVVPVEQHWCSYWQALAASRSLLHASCADAGRFGTTWCSGTANRRSLCNALDSAAEGAASALLRPAEWRREQVGFGPRASPGVQQWRYFSVFECGGGNATRAASPPRLRGARLRGANAAAAAAAAVRTARAEGAAEGAPQVCLLHKDKAHETTVMGFSSADGLHFVEPRLVAHKQWPFRMTHNLAILRRPAAAAAASASAGAEGAEGGGGAAGAGGGAAGADGGGEYLLVGGQHSHGIKGSKGQHRGMWLALGAKWHALDKRGGGWRARLILNGSHPGCVERRDPALMPWAALIPGRCEFDGRASLAHFGGRYHLYVRANPAAHGQRFVQVSSSTDLHSWSPFRLLRMQGYRHAQGDVYTFSAQPNPVDPEHSLVALFPVAHLLRGCLCLAASRDGVHWSRPTPVLGCQVNGERTVDHPVSGLLRRGESVHLYVHENVVGVTTSMMSVGPTLARFGYLRLPPSRVVRYAIPSANLAAWSRHALRELDARADSRRGAGG